MTPLFKLIAAQIRARGPITLAHYMDLCLSHPNHGYYRTRTPLGAKGDFITAPEISQMFGELVGLALAQSWLDQGAPDRFVLAELGPGKGTAMADMLRATLGVPGFHAAIQPVLIETSPTLRATQAEALTGWPVTWQDRVEALPDVPLFVLANEFFDALPIRQFQHIDGTWHERMVALTPDGMGLRPGLGPALPPGVLPVRLTPASGATPDGAVVETCPQGAAIAAQIASRIARDGGAALITDYGGPKSRGDTFQAVKSHATVDPFAQPGLADLTAHVDFGALADSATQAGAGVSELTPQGVFLERLGITTRAQALAARLQGKALETHIAAHRRLTHADEMGNLFQCLALYPPSAPPPPGVSI